ncbi:MAG: hypothetical protein ACXVHT_08270, partial [Methanobacterium sp.]
SLSQLFLFPSIIGMDPWWHQNFTSLIMESSYLPDIGYPYEKIPIFHLSIINTSLLTGLNYKLSSIITITFPLVLIGTFITYNIGKYLINYKIGLLGALILVLSNYFINGEIWAIPTTLGGIFLITIIYLLLNLRNRKGVNISVLILLLMFTLILTHTIVSFIMAIILITGWISILYYNYIYKKSKNYFPLILAIIFTVTMLIWWMYASNTFTNVVQLIEWGLRVDPSLVNTPTEVINYISMISLNQQIFINLGVFILFSLSIFGFFFFISRRYTNKKRFLYGFIAIIPLLISFISIISGFSLIEARWLYVAELLLAIPVATSIVILFNHFPNKNLKVALLFGAIFILSFLMITNNNVSNIDNTQFYPDGGITYAFKESEVISFQTISKFDPNFKTDEYYSNMDPNSFDDTSSHYFSDEIYNRNITNINNSIILIRNDIENKPFILMGAINKLDYNMGYSLNQSYFSILYDSGSTKGYMKYT